MFERAPHPRSGSLQHQDHSRSLQVVGHRGQSDLQGCIRHSRKYALVLLSSGITLPILRARFLRAVERLRSSVQTNTWSGGLRGKGLEVECACRYPKRSRWTAPSSARCSGLQYKRRTSNLSQPRTVARPHPNDREPHGQPRSASHFLSNLPSTTRSCGQRSLGRA